MKTILVPTDFSKISRNAIDYAVEMANQTKSKLILFHAYHVPVIPSEVPVMLPTLEEIEMDCMDGLKKIQKTISFKNNKNLTIDCVCKCGLAVDEIKTYTNDNNIDFIVMGIQGAGYLSERLMGSVTTSLIRSAKCPVLIISEHVKFVAPKKIVLACDYLSTQSKSVLKPLEEFVAIFNSHIFVLNVARQFETVPIIEESTTGFVNLTHSLKNTQHSFHTSENENVVNAINDFVIKQKIDMVVMISRQHSILHSIFHEPTTKHMAFHTNVPLLALHE